MVNSSGRYAPCSLMRGCIWAFSVGLMAFTPAIVLTSVVPENISHLEGNSPTCSAVTSSWNMMTEPRLKSEEVATCGLSSAASTSASFSLFFLPFLPLTASVAASSVLSRALSIPRSIALSTLLLAFHLADSFTRLKRPWASAVIAIANNMANTNTSFFISNNV